MEFTAKWENVEVDAMCPWSLLAATSAPTENLSIFSPSSPSAQSIVDLSILTFAIAALIFAIVEGILFYCVWRFRRSKHDPEGEPAQVYGSQPIEVAWTAAPAMIVFFLVLVTSRTLWEVKPKQPLARSGDNALFVTVIGHQWWWEYVYETYEGRKLNFVTANELHIPVSDAETTRKVYLSLVSADVCHSFWVPRLNGKMDLIPGHMNPLDLQTTEPGLYLGQCAEFCGEQHANMMLRVVAESPDDFEKWLANEAQPAVEDAAVRAGQQAFLAESCVNCHRIRGTAAAGTYAPDLTHLMSRATLAAGMIPNTRENLHDWVRDPQQIKEGCLMPAFGLSDKKLDLIVEYLRTLK